MALNKQAVAVGGVKLANIRLAEVIPVAPAHLVSREPMERRVERMRALLAKGGAIAAILSAIRELMNPPEPKRRPIGFTADIEDKK